MLALVFLDVLFVCFSLQLLSEEQSIGGLAALGLYIGFVGCCAATVPDTVKNKQNDNSVFMADASDANYIKCTRKAY